MTHMQKEKNLFTAKTAREALSVLDTKDLEGLKFEDACCDGFRIHYQPEVKNGNCPYWEGSETSVTKISGVLVTDLTGSQEVFCDHCVDYFKIEDLTLKDYTFIAVMINLGALFINRDDEIDAFYHYHQVKKQLPEVVKHKALNNFFEKKLGSVFKNPPRELFNLEALGEIMARKALLKDQPQWMLHTSDQQLETIRNNWVEEVITYLKKHPGQTLLENARSTHFVKLLDALPAVEGILALPPIFYPAARSGSYRRVSAHLVDEKLTNEQLETLSKLIDSSSDDSLYEDLPAAYQAVVALT